MKERRKILVIDDDHDVVLGTSLRLRSAGYETVAAYDGEEGIAAAIDLCPDAIVLDVRMPRLDGLSALERLRRYAGTRDIPVVIVSASLVDRHAALDSGARYFLPKPYHAKSLLTALASAIDEN